MGLRKKKSLGGSKVFFIALGCGPGGSRGHPTLRRELGSPTLATSPQPGRVSFFPDQIFGVDFSSAPKQLGRGVSNRTSSMLRRSWKDKEKEGWRRRWPGRLIGRRGTSHYEKQEPNVSCFFFSSETNIASIAYLYYQRHILNILYSFFLN